MSTLLRTFGISELPGSVLSNLLADLMRFTHPSPFPPPPTESEEGSDELEKAFLDFLTQGCSSDQGSGSSLEPTAEERAALKRGTNRKLTLLHELKQAHGEYIAELWSVLRHVQQWATWGTSFRLIHTDNNANIPEDIHAGHRDLQNFINGFTAIVVLLSQEHADFNPPEPER